MKSINLFIIFYFLLSVQAKAASNVEISSFIGTWSGAASSTFSHWSNPVWSCSAQPTTITLQLKNGKLVVYGTGGCCRSVSDPGAIGISASLPNVKVNNNRLSFYYENITQDIYRQQSFSAELINGAMLVNFSDYYALQKWQFNFGFDQQKINFFSQQLLKQSEY